MTLACEDANSKVVDVVTVSDVDDVDHVGSSLLQFWKLRFGHKAKLFFQTMSTCIERCKDLVNILKLKFRQDL